MKNILSHMYASRNVLFAVVVIIAALFGCDMPGPSPNPTPPRDTQAPSVAPAVELEGGGERLLTMQQMSIPQAIA